MIYLEQFGINKHLLRPQVLLVFEKFTFAYIFQIVLKIMWLPIQKTENILNHININVY
mgnify:CR=1 FL=1